MHTELGTVMAGKTRYLVCEHASLEDARRIVACVNACEGIPDSRLGNIANWLPMIERERELVEALTYCEISTRADGQWADQSVHTFLLGVLAKHGR